MGKSNSVNTPPPRWKRSAEKGTLVGVRLQAEQLKAIDAWAAKQKPPVTRPEAIRGILELGLKVKTKSKQAPVERATRARELAAKVIEKISDPSASQEERTQRRRRITRGPSEFREDRVDLPKPKR